MINKGLREKELLKDPTKRIRKKKERENTTEDQRRPRDINEVIIKRQIGLKMKFSR